ncbi:orotidine 5'-phosphate decarboxylase [Varicellaria rhodocarpa]|nr:orotidine 5'-phosphate decarboxylase [Varicellaria rhodocarpa]
MTTRSPFSNRADIPDTHPLAIYLFHLSSIKKSNLCVSADVHSTSALLRLAEDVGDAICILKTHADIIDDFGERTIKGLKDVSRRKKFLIFEDRKFGDIGSQSYLKSVLIAVKLLTGLFFLSGTVQAQYTRGPLAIATWAHLVNAHIFPGLAIISSLQSAAFSTLERLTQCVSTEISAGTPRISSDLDEEEGKSDYGFIRTNEKRPPEDSGRKGSVVTAVTTISQTVEKNERTLSRSGSTGEREIGDREEELAELGEPPLARGLLLLAEMSSEGNLITGDYTKKCVSAARSHADFVVGFISQRSLNEKKGDNFLSLTPGVNMPTEGESSRKTTTDGMGQQYRTPDKVVLQDGCDIVIVGRGILGAKDRRKEAERYRKEAWKSYTARIGKNKK